MNLLMGCLAAAVLMAAVPAAGKTKILLIGHKHDHPPGTHMYLEVCGLLAKCLRQSPNTEAVVSDGWPSDPAVLKDVRAVVLYTSPGGTLLLDPAHRSQAEELLKRGVGLVAIHWATDAKPELGPDYQKLLGGWFNTSFSRLEVTTRPLSRPNPSHPICRGWTLPEWHEEFYMDLRYQPEIQPLLQAEDQGKTQVFAWAYERPGSRGGRSFATTLGHFYDNFKSEPFRRLLVNGILWAAHRDIPREGAPCRLRDEELAGG